MSKTKEVTKEQLIHIRDLLKKADDECKSLHEEGKKDYMQPILNVMKEAQEYLKEQVEPIGLYKYSQEAMYGRGVERSEEISIASHIYLDMNHDESLPAILGVTHD